MRGRLLALLACVAMAAGVVAMPVPAGAQSVGDARRRAAALQRELVEARKQAAIALAEYDSIYDDLGDVVLRRFAAAQAVEAARAASEAGRETANQRIRAVYESGGELVLYASLLNSRSPHDMLARARNIDAVLSADRATVVLDDGVIASLAEAELRLIEIADKQLKLERQSAEKAAHVESVMAAQQRLLDSANADVVRLLEEEQARARAAQAAALRATFDRPGMGGGPYYFPPAGGRFACPVGNVHSFVDTWGAPRSGGRRHEGTDVFAPYDSPAYAVIDGVIDKVGNGGLGGITLWLKAANGDRYYYAHNVVNVAVLGQHVNAGDVVARVGTTGNAEGTSPHVHFEAHPAGGAAANPYPFLDAICA